MVVALVEEEMEIPSIAAMSELVLVEYQLWCIIVAVVDKEVVNGRLEKTWVDLYSSSSHGNSAVLSPVTPPPSRRVLSEDAPWPEELVEDMVVVLAPKAEEDCCFKVFCFLLCMAGLLSRSIPGILHP